MTGLRVRVAEVVDETPDIRTLRLVREDGRAFSPFSAGAHMDVTGPTGILRQYSLCSAPGDAGSLLIAVKKEPASRGGSIALHEVSVGDTVLIGKPRNLLTLAREADQHVLVGGGIGITPLLAMAYALHSSGAEFALHYFARSKEEAAFLELLERAEFRTRVHAHLGVPRSRHPERLAEIGESLTTSSHVYTCGPDGFMANVVETFAPTVGLDHVHLERFVAEAVDTSEDTGFTVALDTGEEFEVPPGRTILNVLEENGIEVFTSCQEGVCGSCVSGLLDGVADHRDHCLTAAEKAEGKQIAVCVSRAKTPRLLIELY